MPYDVKHLGDWYIFCSALPDARNVGRHIFAVNHMVLVWDYFQKYSELESEEDRVDWRTNVVSNDKGFLDLLAVAAADGQVPSPLRSDSWSKCVRQWSGFCRNGRSGPYDMKKVSAFVFFLSATPRQAQATLCKHIEEQLPQFFDVLIRGGFSPPTPAAVPEPTEQTSLHSSEHSRSMLGRLDALPTRALPGRFRNILLKRWQEIPIDECPRPPSPITGYSPPPFSLKPGGEVYYVDGWHIGLRRNGRYLLTYTFGRSQVWPEIEIVLYQREPRTGLWKRDVSCGAVTSDECAAGVTPYSEDWLITCWGKHVIAWDAPWWPFVPKTHEPDGAASTLHFAPPDWSDGEGRLPVSAPVPLSAIRIQAVE